MEALWVQLQIIVKISSFSQPFCLQFVMLPATRTVYVPAQSSSPPPALLTVVTVPGSVCSAYSRQYMLKQDSLYHT
jgi:hypothetical protein